MQRTLSAGVGGPLRSPSAKRVVVRSAIEFHVEIFNSAGWR